MSRDLRSVNPDFLSKEQREVREKQLTANCDCELGYCQFGWTQEVCRNNDIPDDQDPIYNALRAGYRFALQMPHNVVRIKGQGALAQMRDAIAAFEGRSPEEVQNEYEEEILNGLHEAVSPLFKAIGEEG